MFRFEPGPLVFCATIPGRVFVKKNTQRVVGLGRSKRAIYSKQFMAWQNAALCFLSGARLADPVDVPVILWLKFFFQHRGAEADVSNLVEGVQDVLVTAQILEDDKLVHKLIAEKHFGEEPRVEIEIREVVG